MLLEGKMKRVAVLAAVDVYLRKMKNSPKRCARNLIELGLSAYPGKISGNEENELYQKLLTSLKSDNVSEARALFTSVFL